MGSSDGRLRVTDFKAAARDYFDRGWTAIPLVLDANNLPKRPFSNDWQHTLHDWEQISALPWNQALGIGLVLGPASDNLAVIDIDCVPLAAELLRVLQGRPGAKFYYVRTGRNRCHLYFREGTATNPRTMNGLTWRGETFGVELKGKGQQVAAPPTPNYVLCGTTNDPTPIPTIEQAWLPIAATMGITGAKTHRIGSAGYPSAWKETLAEGERNNAVYVEACRLAEARMPLDSAISTMLARVRVAYAGVLDERGIVATVRSAYRRVARKEAPRGGVPIP